MSTRKEHAMPGELGFDTGPYVQAALFCERALQESDGVLSLMRIVDQINVQGQGPDAPTSFPEGTAVPLQTTFVVMLKPGEARGTQSLRVDLEAPDGTRQTLTETSLSFTGGPNNGQNMLLNLNMGIDKMGLYWADVFVNGRLVTRVPLQITYGYQK